MLVCAALLVLLCLLDLLRQALDAVAAVVGDGAPQFALLAPLLLALRLKPVDLRCVARQLVRQVFQAS